MGDGKYRQLAFDLKSNETLHDVGRRGVAAERQRGDAAHGVDHECADRCRGDSLLDGLENEVGIVGLVVGRRILGCEYIEIVGALFGSAALVDNTFGVDIEHFSA